MLWAREGFSATINTMHDMAAIYREPHSLWVLSSLTCNSQHENHQLNGRGCDRRAQPSSAFPWQTLGSGAPRIPHGWLVHMYHDMYRDKSHQRWIPRLGTCQNVLESLCA